MKITTENKAILWNIIEKYDETNTDLCDSLSRLIQGTSNGVDLLTIYGSLLEIETVDSKKIDDSIGSEIDACLFSI